MTKKNNINMNIKDKIFIMFAILLFGVVSSYMVFGWSEPSGTMPTNYKIPINTSIESQDVIEGKPVIVNLNADKLDGYDASDLLGGSQDASFNIIEGTSCPSGSMAMSRYYEAKTCTGTSYNCNSNPDGTNCRAVYSQPSCTSPSGWGLDNITCTFSNAIYSCSMNCYTPPGSDVVCWCSGTLTNSWNTTCTSINTHVLCMTINDPE